MKYQLRLLPNYTVVSYCASRDPFLGNFYPYNGTFSITTEDKSEESSIRYEYGIPSTSGIGITRQAVYFNKDIISSFRNPFAIVPFKGFSQIFKFDIVVHRDDALVLKLSHY